MVDASRDNGIIVGRDPQLSKVQELMASTESAKGVSLLLKGEAGIGKTTIARKVAADAQERGWAVMSSECLFGEGGEPYFPIIRAIQDFIEGPGSQGNGPSRASGVDSAPLSLPAGLLAYGTTDTETASTGHISRAELTMERDRMFEQVTDLLKEASAISPVLLFIDDLHWADKSTLQLLYYIIRTGSSERLMFIGAYRPEDLDTARARHPMTDFLTRLRREGLIQEIDVPRFGPGETTKLVATLSEGEVQDSFADRVYKDTGGNPYFIKEFVQAIGGPGSKGEDEDMAIPSNVSSFILDRVRRLDDQEQRVLQLGAVLGQEFRYNFMVGSCDMDEEEVINVLEGLVNKKVLEEREDVGSDEILYRFNHNLFREVIYNHMSRTKRRLLHKRVGECLERLFVGKPEAIVYPLAYHFSRTADMVKAFDYSTLAGKMAFKAFAFDDAIELLETALELLMRQEDIEDAESKEIDLLSTIGQTYNFLGNSAKALECHNRALEISLDGTVERALVLRNIAEVQMECGEWKRAVKTFERALTISRGLDETAGMASAYRGLVWLCVELGHHTKAIDYAEKCLKEAKRANDTHLQGKVLLDLGNMYNIRNEHEKALHMYEEALNVLDHTKHLDQISRVYNNTGDVYMKTQKYDRALDCFHNCLEIARLTGDSRRLSYGMTNLGLCQGKMGRLEESIANLERAETLFNNGGDRYGITIVLISKALVLRDSGDLARAEGLLKRAIQLSQEFDFAMLHALAEIEYGVLLKRAGRVKEAIRQRDIGLRLKEELEKKARVGSLEEGLKELEDIED